MAERWCAVVGYEGRYDVSDEGRVRALFIGKRGVKSPPRYVGINKQRWAHV
jgi:hypothetical protein